MNTENSNRSEEQRICGSNGKAECPQSRSRTFWRTGCECPNACVSDGPADGNENKNSAYGPFAASNLFSNFMSDKTHDYEAPISLNRHQICKAMREIGLGAKLTNEALVALGFRLKLFPKPPPSPEDSENVKNQAREPSAPNTTKTP